MGNLENRRADHLLKSPFDSVRIVDSQHGGQAHNLVFSEATPDGASQCFEVLDVLQAPGEQERPGFTSQTETCKGQGIAPGPGPGVAQGREHAFRVEILHALDIQHQAGRVVFPRLDAGPHGRGHAIGGPECAELSGKNYIVLPGAGVLNSPPRQNAAETVQGAGDGISARLVERMLRETLPKILEGKPGVLAGPLLAGQGAQQIEQAAAQIHRPGGADDGNTAPPVRREPRGGKAGETAADHRNVHMDNARLGHFLPRFQGASRLKKPQCMPWVSSAWAS